MRPLVEALSKIAVASAIASSASERAHKNDAHLWSELDDCAMNALQAFPGQLNKKEMAVLQSRLSDFFRKMGWEKNPKHPQTMLVFSSELLLQLRYELIQHNAAASRISALDKLIAAEADIYDHYQRQAGREYALCAMSGMKAAYEWDRTWN